jgi:hypothetical protein
MAGIDIQIQGASDVMLRRLMAVFLAFSCSGCATLLERPASELQIQVLTDRGVSPSDVAVTIENIKTGQVVIEHGTAVRFALKEKVDYRVTASLPGGLPRQEDVFYNGFFAVG